MKNLIYKLIYSPRVNYILRNFFKPIAKLCGKPLFLSVSGKLNLKYKDIPFSLHTNQTSYVTQELFLNGSEKYEFTPLFEHLISQSKVFFDIGANIGYFTILGGKINTDTQIFAFEPSIGPLHYLHKNIAENNLKNVQIISKAVAQLDGKLDFYDVISTKYTWIKHNLSGSNSLQNLHGKSKSKHYQVEVTTLDTVVNDFHLSHLDLIKIDTECTEHEIIESSLDIINKFQPIIICEVYDVISEQMQFCINKMDNYIVYQYKNATLLRIKNLKDVSEDRNDRNFVFTPASKLEILTQFIR